MSLVSAILNRAHRVLAINDAANALEALDAQTAIEALNAMCTRWEANGMAIGWANVSAVGDTMPSVDEAEDAIVYNLAMRIATEYGVTPSREVAMQAAQGLTELRRDRLTEMPIKLTSDLPSSRGYWNIYTDEPV